MTRLFILFFILINFIGCNKKIEESKKVELMFLDDYIFPANQFFDSTKVGGLSGIDYYDGNYYLVADDSKLPRYYKATIEIKKKLIVQIDFVDMVLLRDHPYYENQTLDLESIVFDTNNQITMVSEGAINKNKNPLLFSANYKGEFLFDFELPTNFLVSHEPKPIHNKTLEGLSHSFNKDGFWTAFELPLIQDGDEPSYQKANSPIRITYFDKKTRKATKEFAYQLEPITKPYVGDYNLNGLTDILEFKPNHFIVIERTYQSEKGTQGNTINLFHAWIEKTSTNTLTINSLKQTDFIPLKKELVFSFDTVKNKLTEGIIDNIEGITLGPILENGNQSIILISDDNFQLFGKQLNQFLLLEIKE